MIEGSGDAACALVYMPSITSKFIDISDSPVAEVAITAAMILAATAGIFLVATATIYLFRK